MAATCEGSKRQSGQSREHCFTREKDVAILAYHVSAERDDTPIYEALCTSSYLKDNGTWRRMVHQQTPLS